MSKDKVHETALALFNLISDSNVPAEIHDWLQELAVVAVEHIRMLEEMEEAGEEVGEVELALLAIMEPFLFLYGVALKNHWIDRIDEEEH